MGAIRKQVPVKLVIGFIFKEEKIFREVKINLERRFGGIDFESQNLLFNHTDYYKDEFGDNLTRKFVSFKKLISPEALPLIKIFTNKIEKKSSKNAKRLINIDPGYVDLAKLVLASTKDFKHRLYWDKGIFAEITLFYQHRSFRPWEWTYPDYATSEYILIFNHIRGIYAQQIRD